MTRFVRHQEHNSSTTPAAGDALQSLFSRLESKERSGSLSKVERQDSKDTNKDNLSDSEVGINLLKLLMLWLST